LNRGAGAFEAQLPGFPAEIADLGNGRAGDVVRQLALGLLDRNQHGAGLLAGLRIGRGVVDAAEHEDAIGAIRESAPVFVAGDDPLVALAPGAGRDARQVGPGLRFRQGAGTEIISAQHGRNLLLAFRRRAGNRLVKFVGTRKQARDAHPTSRELLGHETVLESSQSEPAILLRNENAEESQLAHPGNELAGNVSVLRVELVRDRRHLLARELTRHVAHHDSLGSQVAATDRRTRFIHRGLRFARHCRRVARRNSQAIKVGLVQDIA